MLKTASNENGRKDFKIGNVLLRFSVRTLLVFSFFVTIATWYLVSWQKQVAVEQQAISDCIAEYNAEINCTADYAPEGGLWVFKKRKRPKLSLLSRIVFGKNPYSHAIDFQINENVSTKCLDRIKPLPWLERVRIRNASSLEDVSAIENLPNVKRIRFRKCPKLQDLSPLANLPNGCNISISRCPNVCDFRFLSSANEIGALSIEDARLPLLFPPGDQVCLSSFSLSYCDMVKDLDWLRGNQTIERVDIVDCDGLTDATALASLAQLRSMQLSTNRAAAIFAPHLNRLRELSLFDDSLRNLKCLREMTELRSLSIHAWDLEQASTIDNFKHLKNVEIHSDELKSFGFLDQLPKLQSVTLTGGYHCPSIESLSKLPELKKLKLHDFPNTPLKVLEELKNLEELHLEKIEGMTNLEYLGSLKNLRVLTVGYCEDLTNLETMAQLSNLKRLSVFGCKSVSNTNILGKLSNNVDTITWNHKPFVQPANSKKVNAQR